MKRSKMTETLSTSKEVPKIKLGLEDKYKEEKKETVKEAIQIYGHDVYYIDRTTVAIDNVLGEDSLSKFTTQVPIEMYVENV